nr:uncharacterized protein LOC104114445 isoform X2 [Nicotiana tomentosiformis]
MHLKIHEDLNYLMMIFGREVKYGDLWTLDLINGTWSLSIDVLHHFVSRYWCWSHQHLVVSLLGFNYIGDLRTHAQVQGTGPLLVRLLKFAVA